MSNPKQTGAILNAQTKKTSEHRPAFYDIDYQK